MQSPLPTPGRFRDAFAEVSRDPSLRAVILTAEGKGFNAGIDIKEMQSVEGFEHLLGSSEACYATFHQIYETPVPVIAAVNDFCMGLGIGLVGSADIIIASSKARFGLPEVDNGALGCASHLARLVPPMKLRQMTFTCLPATAQELHEYGTVFKVTEPDELREEARALARLIADKPSSAVRFAKAALNHIDPVDLHSNYRLEQGYTYQPQHHGHRRSTARRVREERTRSNSLVDGSRGTRWVGSKEKSRS